jgi:hypothetical protein
MMEFDMTFGKLMTLGFSRELAVQSAEFCALRLIRSNPSATLKSKPTPPDS